MWQPGDVVVLRYRSMSGGYEGGAPAAGGCQRRRASRCVHRGGNRDVSAGSRRWPGLRDVPLEQRLNHPRSSVRRPWLHTDVVMIFPRGRRHSLWVMHEHGQLAGWYVNLEAAHVFGERTISTEDGVLDVWVDAETREAVWKDEDEFAVAIRVGRLPEREAQALREEGERVMAEQPWPTGWENWQPPHDWVRPALPDDWRDMC